MSVWEEINKIIDKADILDYLVKLRMERPGETRKSALKWALKKMEEYDHY